MGLHRHGGRADDRFRAYVEAVRPPFVKMLDPGEDGNVLAGWCKARGVETIGRNFFGDGQHLSGGDLRSNINEVRNLAMRCPNIGYWELHNEAWDQPGDMARYSDASLEFMAVMESLGRKAVIGCFAQGTPEVTGDNPSLEWSEYLPAVKHAIAHGHILGLHEYSGPFMDFEVGWHCLRYRKALAILASLGADVARLKVAITESGIDDVWGRPGPLGKGYKPFNGTEWSRPPASQHGDYAGQLLWYGNELSRDRQIVGWVDFGWADESGDWGDFDLSTDPAMLQRVTILQRQLPGASSGGPAMPTLNDALFTEAAARQRIRLNPTAAIQRAIMREGYVPTSDEFDVTHNGTGYVAQRAERLDSGEVRVFYCAKGAWGDVRQAVK